MILVKMQSRHQSQSELEVTYFITFHALFPKVKE
jgi:hypothetical protein